MARVRGKLTDASGRTWNMVTETEQARSYGKQFMVVFTEAAAELARDRTMQGMGYRMLFWSMANLHHERWSMISQEAIGNELHVAQNSVGRALKQLEERGFIERRGSGPRQEWRLTPKGTWQGTAARYHKTRRARGENDKGLKVAADNTAQTEVVKPRSSGNRLGLANVVRPTDDPPKAS